MEQLGPVPSFQGRGGSAGGRLRQVKCLGGTGDVLTFGDGGENSKLVEVLSLRDGTARSAPDDRTNLLSESGRSKTFSVRSDQGRRADARFCMTSSASIGLGSGPFTQLGAV